jgi:glutathione S-transferase
MKFNERELAFLYLGIYGDEQNKVSLYDNFLTITSNGRFSAFPREFINGIFISRKKTIFHIVIGGIASSLALVSIFTGYYLNPWLALIILFVGLFILYYGWMGTFFLTISEKDSEMNFLLKATGKNLETFIDFVNSQLEKTNAKLFIYHIAEMQEWEKQKDSIYYETPDLKDTRFIHACLENQIDDVKKRFFINGEPLICLKIDALELSIPVKFEKGEDVEDIFPHIYGRIPKSKITEVFPLS